MPDLKTGQALSCCLDWFPGEIYISLKSNYSVFVLKSLITHHEENIRMICNLLLQVFREHLYSWLVQQGGWVSDAASRVTVSRKKISLFCSLDFSR